LRRPKHIDLTVEDIDALLKRIKNTVSPADYEIIKTMAETINLLSDSVDAKGASIRRLLGMIFGNHTEKLKNVIKPEDSTTKPEPEKKKKGHGRKPAIEYTGAKKVNISHAALKSGDNCPECLKGKVYELLEPKRIVRITGSAPLGGTVYEMQRLRCNLCGEIFTADTPEGVCEDKYDEKSAAMIAVLKYGSGMPFYRLKNLQRNLGIPLPAATQFEIVEKKALDIEPVYAQLQKQAAQGDVIRNDDTTMKILSLLKENKKDNPERKGIFTTGILSTAGDLKIALYFSGRQHAGENLNDLLKKRIAKAPPIQMCDALSRNISPNFARLLANCLSHGRRNFVDVVESFPDDCRHVLEALAKVYKNDHIAKEQKMDANQRLCFHQAESGLVMADLHVWFHNQLNENKVEPNSGLGKAIKYMLNHWDALTLFLRAPNAPLDNNLCEQALKKVILHRKNALFYKTGKGAMVGDLFMSLIHTCELAGINAFEYLTVLFEHAAELAEHPEIWMPWNYLERIAPETNPL